MQLKLKILNPKIKKWGLPKLATCGSAGVDLCACLDEPITLAAGETKLIGTGFAIYIKNPNYAGFILPRSGLGHKHGVVLGNLVGLIDSDYQGEIKVSCWNRSQTDFVIKPGMRIAQLVIQLVIQPMLEVVDDFEKTRRGDGGFGHTGVNT